MNRSTWRSTNVVPTQHEHSTKTSPARSLCSTSAVPPQHQCSTNKVPVWYPCGTSVAPMWYQSLVKYHDSAMCGRRLLGCAFLQRKQVGEQSSSRLLASRSHPAIPLGAGDCDFIHLLGQRADMRVRAQQQPRACIASDHCVLIDVLLAGRAQRSATWSRQRIAQHGYDAAITGATSTRTK